MSDDEKFEDVVEGGEGDAALEQAVNDKANTIRQMLGQGRVFDAVDLALSDPPYGTKNQEIKNKNLLACYPAIVAIKDADIDSTLEKLDTTKQDVLMKYLFKFMAMSEDWDEKDERFKDSPKLLKLHAGLVAKAGLGCIVRAISERKTV